MSDRKITAVEAEAEQDARDLEQMPDNWFTAGVMPLACMRASAMLRRMCQRIDRVERDLATERRLHRDTEKRAELYKTERDVARRERDERSRACKST